MSMAKKKSLNQTSSLSFGRGRRGFTLIELMIGGSIMLIVILATLSIYVKSNKTAVDQQAYSEMQHDVRSSMYFITRDIRMAGIGLPQEFMGHYLEGVDNDATDAAAGVTPDRLIMLGNMEDPLNLKIYRYMGSSITLDLDDYSFEENPYPDAYYANKIVIILPRASSPCRVAEIREVTHVTHNTGATNEKLNFSPGLAIQINPPGGLSGTCSDSSDYDGGSVTFADVKEFWLDVTGYYPGLSAGTNGYIGNGNGNILYMTANGIHFPIAQNVENLQFQYNGDLDNDGNLDGFQDWNANWTVDEVSRIRQVRVWVLGKTKNKFVSVSGTPPDNIYLFRRPAIANTTVPGPNDLCRRFLLDSTANVRNMTLNIYNTGLR
jgi:prepilin-type N-terminal cleavage/methylation domain-containing protein